MKKTIIASFGLLLISGCSIGSQSFSLQGNEVKIHSIAESGLEARSFTTHIELIDARNKQTVKIIDPKDYGTASEYEQEMVKLAKELAGTIDQPMVPVKLNNGNLTRGESRVILEEAKLVSQLTNLTAFDHRIELPIVETKPNVTQASVQGINESVLGSFTTRFDPKVKGRTTNIEISANEINQIVLGPGDRFYFNTIVGDSTPDKGYQLAIVIENKQFVEGYGGGVCQTSTTLYNAVKNAGLEILELHHHSKTVGYVPIGMDATVAYGFKDFKFMNNKNYPIIIHTNVDKNNGTLEVKITAASQYASIN